MAVATTPQRPQSRQTTLAGIARALVQHEKLRLDQATQLQQAADEAGTGFVDALLDGGAMSPRQLAAFAAEVFGHPLLDLSAVDPASLPADALDRKFATDAGVVALGKRGGRISVAVSDPTDTKLLDRIRFSAQASVEAIVVEHDKLKRLVDKLGRSAAEQLDDIAGEVEGVDVTGDDQASQVDSSDIDDAPVVRFLQKILVDAIQAGASDLHFEPFEKFYRIRFRVDGELREIAQPPLAIKEKLASRIKVISKLDISEKRVPQDGRMKLVLSGNRAIDFRVSTLPTLFGEKIVMRILDPSQAKMGIDALGYEPDQKAALVEAIRRPYGMVLVTGPTGSGKTVSLYTCLNILNEPGINISTAEDPAEINLPGVNQVNVNEKAGLTFAAALRAFLRQDPDVIMVGEIRDLETADIAIKAAQTGHLVMSTLHTNDAPTTLTRLANMGVPAFNIASSVSLITAQRLARRLCGCKQPLDVDEGGLLTAGFLESDLDGSWVPYRPVGCERCNGSGYKGRVGIYQVMPITEEMQKLILAGGNALQIAAQAEAEGVRDLRRSGLMKVMQGLTSIEEVLGVTNE
ncbi:type IV-A pilus assembly ATPase PilB [Burkholderiaceae bacterium FT117]|uniref:type IV-A pilus assembly ATPase PilB n=1 Tax=Zeimonas sediminis TaxID=2944268 RepID=UPI0023430901|nr:type IV-A pilus assembly ATPase PilB [Zeimonas sediminis]MCM5570764.1 type IV-A pilus assembly ATPase PilB [Zeimonas sediminis]